MLLMVCWLGWELAHLIHQLSPSVQPATIQPKLDVAYRPATVTDAELTITLPVFV